MGLGAGAGDRSVDRCLFNLLLVFRRVVEICARIMSFQVTGDGDLREGSNGGVRAHLGAA